MIEPADPITKRLELAGFLGEVDGKAWAWGDWDCTMMVAHWVERLHGINPAEGIAYCSAAEAVELARRHGGFTGWVIRTFDALGFRRALDYEPGDIAVLAGGKYALPIVAGVMAIRSGEMWVVKTPRGLLGRDFQPVTAWRL